MPLFPFAPLPFFLFDCVVENFCSFQFFPTLVFSFMYLKLSSHKTANMVFQLKQLYPWLFWMRHSMVQLQFVHLRWDNSYIKGYYFFPIDWSLSSLQSLYFLFMFWCFHLTCWEAMCTFLFSFNNRRGSKSWICLSSAIIRQKEIQGSNLIFCHWY